ncbi:SusC/RagA family TonB-linked outer membrane protein [Salinibacter sp.]|uniref:SusC/RagA family TonB-linked outer membrane protein n=1 Tax=Salinibacter sp. TaxID=2065818 RepID=UPI0021E8AAE1|nr:SusC/RagA family TonB-linked outer membrane protein [Salinibacter sp.]
MKRLIPSVVFGLALLLLPGLAWAQQGTVTGTITEAETENPLPGATVQVQGEGTGTASGSDGQYRIEGVPAGEQTIRVSFVGYQPQERTVNVPAGGTIRANFQLRTSQAELDEVVVTGVATGTDTEKLGFDVAQVSGDALSEVPATDPANALRGKVAGAQIAEGSGAPGVSPSIQLRGATSITGDRSPLVIVDGVITSGGLSDISMQDVTSIEVTKGAAASSLYGSLAGNGVIQIQTQDGAQTGDLDVTVRSEVGASQVAGDYPSATRHPWTVEGMEVQLPNGNTETVSGNNAQEQVRNFPDGTKILSWPGRSNETFDVEEDGTRLFDNPFPSTFNNVENAVTSKLNTTNFVSIAGTQEEFNYKVSYENFQQDGILEPVGSYNRNTFRFNGDYSPEGRLSVSANASYVTSSGPVIEEQGQDDNYFYGLLTADPYIDMTEKNDQGEFAFEPTGYDVQQSNFSSPYYVAQNRTWENDQNRLFGGVELNFDILDNWVLTGRQSIDRTNLRTELFYPKGYQTPDDDALLESGLDNREDDQRQDLITEVSTTYNDEFRDLAYTATAKYLYEQREIDDLFLEGAGFPASGIRSVGATDSENYSIGSFTSEEKTENFFFNLDLDYQDTYILSGLVRRDGSSLFGEDERWQTYFRGSLAYRLTEDFDIPNVSELKLRGAYGTSGNRPPFSAQYETYNATESGLQVQNLGNSELRASTIFETSIGIDATFLQRFNLTVNYSDSRTEDDYLQVPLPGGVGFSNQFQNIGEVESTTWEASLDSQVLTGDDGPSWSVGATFSRVRQEITDLAGAPAFTRDPANLDSDNTEAPALSLFRVEEGVPFGAMYGNKLLTSLDQLTVVDGEVLNSGGSSRDDFMINNQGYVIPAGTEGTPNEQPVYMVNEDGGTAVTQIGNTRPDFQVGLRSNFTWKGFGVYGLLDWSQGGDVYNYSKQLLYFNYRHEDQQDFAEQGKDISYSDGSSNIYNQGGPSSYFVEDATFVKLRELSISYTLDQNLLQSAFGVGAVERIKLSVIGRNLFTITDYSGWDPEVGLRSDANNFKLDEYAYPNFRTFTGSVSVQF